MAYTTINDPSEYFHIRLYTSNNGELAVTNNANFGDFQPDWIWIKDRGATIDHILSDTSRGITKRLESNTDDAEGANSQDVKSVQSNGFTVGNNNGVNAGTSPHVAWQWKANGGTATATVSESGNNPANVRQTNTDAGFSIITYTGTGAVGTIAHGLGVVPEWIVVKNRGRTKDWCVYHHQIASDPQTDKIELNLDGAVSDDGAVWNDTAPTSSVFTVGPSDERTNANDDTYVAYCFAGIQGYSKFGMYPGNGNANGAFVYTGFKPAWVLLKRFDSGNNWHLHDIKRSNTGGNPQDDILYPNLTNVEQDEDVDLLSNGFKLRVTGGGHNNGSGKYIYMAFAESPFVSSDGVPTTAR